MVSYCAVFGCTNKQKKDFRLYTFPRVHKQVICKKKIDLLQIRRKAWYNALNRKDIFIKNLDSRYICEKHFVSGSPCDVMDVDNVDWCPSLNLPKIEDEKKKCSSLKRDERMKRREKYEQSRDIHYSKVNVEDDPCTDNDLSISASSSSSVPLTPGDGTSTDNDLTSISTSNSTTSTSTSSSNSNQREIFQLANSSTSSPNAISTCDLIMKEYQLRLEEIYQLRNQLDESNMSEKTFEEKDEKVRFYTGLTSYKLLKLIQNTIEEPLRRDTNSQVESNKFSETFTNSYETEE